MVFGSFHYPLGLLHFTYSDDVAAILDQIMRGEKITVTENEEEMIQLAYRSSSILHEWRHFIDQFGTFSGICLVGVYLDCLKSFAVAVHRLRVDRRLWQWPISEWVRQADCPSQVRAFYRRGVAFRRGAEAFVSPFKPLTVEGHLEDLFIDVPYDGNYSIVAASLRFLTQIGEEQTPWTLLYPMGLEALFEGSAHAISRSFVESHFPETVAEALKQRIRTLSADSRADPGAGVMPYMAADLAVSRFMRNHGVERFERDLVLGLADKALSESPFTIRDLAPGATGAEVVSPGESFRRALDPECVGDFQRGIVRPSAQDDRLYGQLLSDYEKGGDWDTVEDDGTLLASLRIWESYLAQNVTVPLLRARLASSHRAFRSASGMTDLLRVAVPPVIVMGDEFKMGALPPRVQQAWAQQMMAGQIAMRIIDEEPLACPRAWRTIPGLEHLSLVRPGSGQCGDYIPLGCGSFRGGPQIIEPPCFFQASLQAYAFISDKPAGQVAGERSEATGGDASGGDQFRAEPQRRRTKDKSGSRLHSPRGRGG